MGYARPFDLEASTPIERLAPARTDSEELLGLELLRFASALAVLVFHYRHFAHVADATVNPLFLLTYIGGTLAVAAISYRAFEAPIQRWLVRRTLTAHAAA